MARHLLATLYGSETQYTEYSFLFFPPLEFFIFSLTHFRDKISSSLIIREQL